MHWGTFPLMIQKMLAHTFEYAIGLSLGQLDSLDLKHKWVGRQTFIYVYIYLYTGKGQCVYVFIYVFIYMPLQLVTNLAPAYQLCNGCFTIDDAISYCVSEVRMQQSRYLFKFTGKEEEINLQGDGTEKPEFGQWSWMTPEQIIEHVSTII